MLTPDAIRDRLAEIKAISGDPEAAHVREDQLREDVLRAIATGEVRRKDAAEMARLALTTDDISFDRWYA